MAVAIAMHRYLWARLVRDARLPRPWRIAGTALIAAGGLALPAAFVARYTLRDLLGPVATFGAAWLGVALFLLVFLLPWELIRPLWRLRRRTALPDAPTDPDRRQFLGRVAAGSTTLGAGAVSGFGLVNQLETPEVAVRLARLPRALDGFRIALLSDIHIGPVLGRGYLQHAIETANRLKPDMVAITGDLVDGSVAVLGDDIAALRGLRSRYGTFFVTGNHEYYVDAAQWTAFLRRLGVRVLENQRVSIGDASASFDLAGVPDPRARRYRLPSPDVAATVAGRDPDRELVLLAHRPHMVDAAAEAGVGLQLSGHTHGGQLWPLGLLVHLAEPYVRGLHRHGDHTQIYVTRGVGFTGPPMRTLSPPEVTAITLVAG